MEEGWLPADELKSGMHVQQANGEYGLVWLKWNVNKTQEMYNLTVDTAHTFFVGDGQWLVHNTCPVKFDPKQLQEKFKHASDFGVDDNWSKTGAQNFQTALDQHIADPNTITVSGTYRNTIPATHYFNPKTLRNVVADEFDNFISGWKLYPSQVEDLLWRHNIR